MSREAIDRNKKIAPVVITVSLFIFLSNFGVFGPLGNAISGFFFGIFGWIQYILPLYIAGIFILRLNPGRIRLRRKTIVWTVILLTTIAFTIQLLESTELIGIRNFYHACSEKKSGGGLIFGGLLKYLCVYVDVAGALILIVFLYLISFIEITGWSVIGIFKGVLHPGRNNDFEAIEGMGIKSMDSPQDRPLARQRDEERIQMHNPVQDSEKNWGKQSDESIVKTSGRKRVKQPEPDTEGTSEKVKRRKVLLPAYSQENYNAPPLSLLHEDDSKKHMDRQALQEKAGSIEETLANFGIPVHVVDICQGATVTRFELQVDSGVNLNKIGSYSNNLMSCLRAKSVRIISPIPGKSTVGIEIPNDHVSTVYLRHMLESDAYEKASSALSVPIGEDIEGNVLISDIAKMPHLLIAGATNTGKSVLLNALLISILYRRSPEQVRLVIIDPKQVEFQAYEDLPHLLLPVVTDLKQAAPTLEWIVNLMEERYGLFSKLGVNNLFAYNDLAGQNLVETEEGEKLESLPSVLVVLDEFGDLIMGAKTNVQDYVIRLGQKARAAGIHLILATQRPSSKIIDGDIKANIPGIIALRTANATNSRVIMEESGAEKLLGKGDMFFVDPAFGPIRAQGALIEPQEVQVVTDYIRGHNPPVEYEHKAERAIQEMLAPEGRSGSDDRDELYEDALEYVLSLDEISVGKLQRKYRIGFNRAARLMEELYEGGVVGPEKGTKPREVIKDQ